MKSNLKIIEKRLQALASVSGGFKIEFKPQGEFITIQAQLQLGGWKPCLNNEDYSNRETFVVSSTGASFMIALNDFCSEVERLYKKRREHYEKACKALSGEPNLPEDLKQ